MNSTNQESLVEYGTNSYNLTYIATGIATKFVDGGEAKREQFIHRVKLRGLQPDQRYCNSQNF